MIKGIYHAARSLINHNRNLERLSNNLANINTFGFKRESMFVEILNKSGNIEIKTPIDLRQGSFTQTGNLTNVAIAGEGYFVLKADDHFELTRNGNFLISEDGFLTNQSGKKVLGKNGEINLLTYLSNPEQILTINENGEIKIGEIIIDSFLIASYDDKIQSLGNAGLRYQHISEINLVDDQFKYKIMQGYLEDSNVNPIIEMENMIKISKDYEASYRIIQSLDESIQKANEIGKT